jgi:hypothetical protein
MAREDMGPAVREDSAARLKHCLGRFPVATWSIALVFQVCAAGCRSAYLPFHGLSRCAVRLALAESLILTPVSISIE